MKPPSATSVLRASCLCALAALALMTWSLFDPTPLPVIAAMSAGQVLGTISFVSFLYVVARDLNQKSIPVDETTESCDEKGISN